MRKQTPAPERSTASGKSQRLVPLSDVLIWARITTPLPPCPHDILIMRRSLGILFFSWRFHGKGAQWTRSNKLLRCLRENIETGPRSMVGRKRAAEFLGASRSHEIAEFEYK